MDANEWQAEQFEQNRAHLRAVARRMLGSAAEADDAVQEAWLRLSRTETAAVENVRGWLTTVVSRICLDMLRTRQARREDFVDQWPADPEVTPFEDSDPEHEALMADSVGLAMLVVLETLSPMERLAFVLHDMFAIPFEEIAPIVERSVPATRQLASRARRRVRGARAPQHATLQRQRSVVEAFLNASRNGDFEGLLAVLDPDVVFRGTGGVTGPQVPAEVRGAEQVAELVLARGRATLGRPAIVDGRPGVAVVFRDQVLALLALTIVDDRVSEMDLLVDPDRLQRVRV
ncbi:MAG TPA: sigma-70 family RNA polymerase sigma factor [Solirubrobacteraceae bacterium]|nr:sigma-70 family RNA polymerase sigma factor [Solirubrobacteraceae bacterium]